MGVGSEINSKGGSSSSGLIVVARRGRNGRYSVLLEVLLKKESML
jgi:hypothetical protein